MAGQLGKYPIVAGQLCKYPIVAGQLGEYLIVAGQLGKYPIVAGQLGKYSTGQETFNSADSYKMPGKVSFHPSTIPYLSCSQYYYNRIFFKISSARLSDHTPSAWKPILYTIWTQIRLLPQEQSD